MEVLTVLFIKHRHQVKLPAELVKFLSCFASKKNILDQGDSSENTGEELISLSNGRSITIPGALTYLVTSSSVYFDIQNALQLETISVSINLINLLLTSHSVHSSSINMSVYENESNNYLGSYHTKIYCNAFEKLVIYLDRQIYTLPSLENNSHNEYSYRISYHHGDILDLLILLNSSTNLMSD